MRFGNNLSRKKHQRNNIDWQDMEPFVSCEEVLL